jgi:hypothetical protein
MSREEEAAYLSAQLDSWLADPLTRKTVMEMYESIRAQSALLAKRLQGVELHRHVKSEILQAFQRGEFVLMRMPHLTILPTLTLKKDQRQEAQQAVGQPDLPPIPEPVRNQKTWVGIELVDQDGMPVPRARYEIQLADGTRKAGTLDENGCGQLRDLEPGSYKVTFPDFDGSEWDAL